MARPKRIDIQNAEIIEIQAQLTERVKEIIRLRKLLAAVKRNAQIERRALVAIAERLSRAIGKAAE